MLERLSVHLCPWQLAIWVEVIVIFRVGESSLPFIEGPLARHALRFHGICELGLRFHDFVLCFDVAQPVPVAFFEPCRVEPPTSPSGSLGRSALLPPFREEVPEQGHVILELVKEL